jgi:hypothetical protein
MLLTAYCAACANFVGAHSHAVAPPHFVGPANTTHLLIRAAKMLYAIFGVNLLAADRYWQKNEKVII